MQRGIAHQTLDRTGCRARRGAQTDRGIESCGLDADPGGRGGEPALGLPDIRPPPDQSCAIDGRDRTRSEEHTSALPALMRISYASFRLKKTNITRFFGKLTIKPSLTPQNTLQLVFDCSVPLLIDSS